MNVSISVVYIFVYFKNGGWTTTCVWIFWKNTKLRTNFTFVSLFFWL